MASTSNTGMDIDENPYSTPPPQPQVQPQLASEQPSSISLNSYSSPSTSKTNGLEAQTGFKDVPVKVHVRRPDRDNWAYLGRAVVSQEAFGQGTRIVVRALSSRKVITAFSEGAPIQAEKRGNFVVVSCVEGGRVISWSLNALNNAETLRLLAILELSCMPCGKNSLPESHSNVHRRRIARLIREDKKRRHKRRKDQDAMVAAFAQTGLGSSSGSDCATPSDVEEPREAQGAEQ